MAANGLQSILYLTDGDLVGETGVPHNISVRVSLGIDPERTRQSIQDLELVARQLIELYKQGEWVADPRPMMPGGYE